MIAPLLTSKALLLALLGALTMRDAREAVRHPRKHEVRMVGSAQAPRFEPAEIQIESGDTVEFVLVSAAPHNVAFDSTSLSKAATERLRKIVHDPMLPLAGPMLLKEGERYTLVFDVPAGRYTYYCMPHMSMQMRGAVVVR